MTVSQQAHQVATIAATAADRMKGEDIQVLDVSGPLVITDAFVLVSADNERLVNAIVDEVEDDLRDAGYRPVRREGVREARWALLDFGMVVVHIFRRQEREFYGLDRLWKDCPTVAIDGVAQHSPVRSDDAATSPDDAARSADSIDDIPLAQSGPDGQERL